MLPDNQTTNVSSPSIDFKAIREYINTNFLSEIAKIVGASLEGYSKCPRCEAKFLTFDEQTRTFSCQLCDDFSMCHPFEFLQECGFVGKGSFGKIIKTFEKQCDDDIKAFIEEHGAEMSEILVETANDKLRDLKKLLGQKNPRQIDFLNKKNVVNMNGNLHEPSWRDGLQVTKEGSVAKTIGNVIHLLENHPDLKGRFYKDVFAISRNGIAPLPWGSRKNQNGVFEWQDEDIAGLRFFAEQELGYSSTDKIEVAFMEVTEKNHVHPIKDYLESLKWDGVPRVETLLIDWYGVEDDSKGYARFVTKRILKSAAKRIYEPGCKLDEIAVFVGDQGTAKTVFWEKLTIDRALTSLTNVDTKIVGEQTKGMWVVVLDELALFKKLSEDEKKEFSSRQVERYRPAYGRNTVSVPRQFIIVGTTNKTEFLGDFTGDRRYLPIVIPDKNYVHDKDPEENLPSIIDQIWAEVMVMYKEDPSIRVPRELYSLLDGQRSAHRYENEWREMVEQALDVLKYPDLVSFELIRDTAPSIAEAVKQKGLSKVKEPVKAAIKECGYESIIGVKKVADKTSRNAFEKVT